MKVQSYTPRADTFAMDTKTLLIQFVVLSLLSYAVIEVTSISAGLDINIKRPTSSFYKRSEKGYVKRGHFRELNRYDDLYKVISFNISSCVILQCDLFSVCLFVKILEEFLGNS